MKIAEAFVEIRPDTKGFGPAVQKEAGSAAQKAKSSFKGLLAGAAVGLFAKGAFNELEEAQKSAKQLEQTIRSTGGAAGVTAGHASDLADQISRASTVDDELVANTERILLTFTQIKNTDIDKTFDRATQAAIDLAAGLGGDAQAAALQLGKALNDPVKGLTALSRAGVSFTQQQKDQVKALADTGQAAKAQGIILSEVEAQFGGQAAAAATGADKARVAFANFQESIGTAFAPAIESAASAVTILSEGFSAQPPILQQVEIAAGLAAVAYAKFDEPVRKAAASLRDFSTSSSGLKGQLGKAGIAGAIAGAALAAEGFFTNFASSRLRTVTGDVDKLAESLAALGGDSSDFDIKGLADDFDKLESTALRVGSNPIFKFTAFGSGSEATLKAAKEDIEAVDQALADLASSGNASEARRQFNELAAGLKAEGTSAEEIKKRFDDYAAALERSGGAASLAADGSVELGDAVEETGHQAKTAAEIIQDFNDELDRYLGKSLDTEEANDRIAQGFIDLADAVKGVKDQKGTQGLVDFEADTEAGLKFREQIRGLVGDYGDLIKTTGATQAESDLLAEAFFRQAKAIGVPEEVAKRYADVLRNIPPDAATEIRQKGMAKALTDSSELAKRLGDVDGRSIRSNVEVTGTKAALEEIARLKAALDSVGATKADARRYFQATGNALGGPMPDGWNTTGEAGPELMFKRGSQVDVFSNQKSRRMVGPGGGGGGGTTVVVQVQGFVVGTERELANQVARLLESLD